FLSAFTDGCIERAQDVRDWNYVLDYRDVVFGGVANVADSLAAIKRLVFEEQKVSMADLIDALKKNWEGKEDLRQVFLN
ncbi:MAG: formate C-acetyltransferase, partial [Syntrophobacterales bacterium CG_4_9_14_3_um_filter_49_8]